MDYRSLPTPETAYDTGMKKIMPLLTVFVMLSPTVALAESFTVTDDRAPIEVSEVSRLYIDGSLAATFRLDDKTPSLTKTIEIPLGRVNHDYALCGQITVINAEGRSETHQVSSQGTLHHPEGHHLLALGDENFTDFFLREPNDPEIARHHPGHADICASPVS
ncbi:hypothetical protein AA0311_2702 [Asaia bogorensis NBRC 16594]|uniref:Uncharacterized protein n=2 Tax=Asaia bogorensis TaxID=91915 RepID=A0AAN4U339_9PROT|nr:hypothetical protein Asbog_01167 [Asaia bogorensis NBRC 16594]GBQ81765.1 hypothetical protein AA0311_2702 [Asaia bogorensis NBRC 16594]GEL54058.1 hypothetical protein ABO01nite_20650 [Asaia bogorensis NBRC 16594]